MVAEYTCPPARGPLRFGNHDRHANPEDCGTFYICLASGQFNKAACDKVGRAGEVTELGLFFVISASSVQRGGRGVSGGEGRAWL